VGGPATKTGRPWLELAVAALVVGALLVTPYLALQAFASGFTFMGTPTAERLAAAKRYSTAALLVGTIVPIVGITATAYTGQRGLRWLFGIVLTITLIGGLAWAEHLSDERRLPPAPSGPPAGCQEHSGGDNRCPGG
jgi:predicted exporter